jgi:hypothetical protein
MPKPIYIICAESGVEDKRTNLVSFFNVLEKLSFFRQGTPPPRGRLSSMRVCAVWMREGDEPMGEYEWELTFITPHSKQEHRVGGGTFIFPNDDARRLFRCTVDVVGTPPIDGSGILSVQHRLRQLGASEWLKQEFPLIIEEMNATTAVGQAATPQ